MTTENTDVSASDSAESIAASVSAAAAPATPAIGEPTAPAVEPATGITLTDLETALNSRQGTQNNWNAQQMRTIEANLSAKLDAAVAPLMARQQAEEQARIEQLEPEDQAAYWKQQATAPAPKPSPAAPQQVQQNGDSYSAEDRLDIINATTNMLSSEGVTVPYTDDRLWAGATNGMTTDQLLGIARQNAQKLKASTSTPPAAVPAATPPPSTQAAPASSSTSYGSRTELNAALLSGEIKNIDEFNRIGQESGILKKR
tara:strand:+ start:318 stop:1091 length:774 start_codon:yes stop_codon:yes gene_type:complete